MKLHRLAGAVAAACAAIAAGPAAAFTFETESLKG